MRPPFGPTHTNLRALDPFMLGSRSEDTSAKGMWSVDAESGGRSWFWGRFSVRLGAEFCIWGWRCVAKGCVPPWFWSTWAWL